MNWVSFVFAALSLLAGIWGVARLQEEATKEQADWLAGGAALLFIISAGFKSAADGTGIDAFFWVMPLVALTVLLILVSARAGGVSLGGWQSILSAIVALLVLVGFAWLFYTLLNMTGANETVWARSVYLYAGVEAMAFGAAGFFFGHVVARGQGAPGSSQLAGAIKAKRDSLNTPTMQALLPDQQVRQAQDILNQLADQADKLFR